MKRFALVMTDNILYKNKFVNDLVTENKDSIKLIIELNFRHPSSNKKKHLQRYLQLLGIKGLIFVIILQLKTYFQQVILSNFNSNGYTLKQIAKINNIKYVKIDNINSEESIHLLKQAKIDYLINSGNQIYKGRILDEYHNKILNRHTSLLPSYGGIYPIFWQLLNGDKEGGVTLHWVTEKIDKGNPAYQKSLEVTADKSLFELYKEAFTISLELCNQAINDLNNNEEKKLTSNKLTSYYSWPTKADIKNFKSNGLKIV